MSTRATASKRSRKETISLGKSVDQIIDHLKSKGNPNSVAGMARYGIATGYAFGVSLPELRTLAKRTRRNHDLADALWESGIHEARLLAGMIDEPARVTENQMDEWASDFDSWDIVDQTCGNLFDKTPFAIKKAYEWTRRPEEYVKRAGFVMMAELAVHNKEERDKTFIDFLPVITREASDDRNFVKKAVNWSLRQIGKRNLKLNRSAIETGKEIQKLGTKPARWIASDALRELTSEPVQRKLKASSKS